MAIEILFFLTATDQKNIPIQMKNAGKTRTKTPNPRGGTPPVQAMIMIGKLARTITRNGVINSGRGGQPVSWKILFSLSRISSTSAKLRKGLTCSGMASGLTNSGCVPCAHHGRPTLAMVGSRWKEYTRGSPSMAKRLVYLIFLKCWNL